MQPLNKIRPLRSVFKAKEFRTLQSATKGSAFGIRKLLKKLDQNFLFQASIILKIDLRD